MDNNQNQRNNNPMGGGGSNSPRRQNIILLLFAALVTMICMTYFLKAFSGDTNKEITYTEFIKMVDEGKVQKIVIECIDGHSNERICFLQNRQKFFQLRRRSVRVQHAVGFSVKKFHDVRKPRIQRRFAAA